jgi:hypothetical protein
MFYWVDQTPHSVLDQTKFPRPFPALRIAPLRSHTPKGSEARHHIDERAPRWFPVSGKELRFVYGRRRHLSVAIPQHAETKQQKRSAYIRNVPRLYFAGVLAC